MFLNASQFAQLSPARNRPISRRFSPAWRSCGFRAFSCSANPARRNAVLVEKRSCVCSPCAIELGTLYEGLPGRIAQLVEQLTLNQRVHGSSPCAPTKFREINGLEVHSCMFSGHWIDGGFLRQKAPPHRHASRLNGDRGVPVRFGRHLSAPSFQQLPLVGTRLRGARVRPDILQVPQALDKSADPYRLQIGDRLGQRPFRLFQGSDIAATTWACDCARDLTASRRRFVDWPAE